MQKLGHARLVWDNNGLRKKYMYVKMESAIIYHLVYVKWPWRCYKLPDYFSTFVGRWLLSKEIFIMWYMSNKGRNTRQYKTTFWTLPHWHLLLFIVTHIVCSFCFTFSYLISARLSSGFIITINSAVQASPQQRTNTKINRSTHGKPNPRQKIHRITISVLRVNKIHLGLTHCNHPKIAKW